MVRKPLLRLILAASLALLGACGKEDHPDLKKELADLTKGLRPHVEPLPEAKRHEPVLYKGADMVDPFTPSRVEVAQSGAPGGAAVRPELNRPREPLEAFPLEQLKIVGLLSKNNIRQATIQAGGNLFQVRKGNYLGSNFGLITDITPTEIRIKELIQDSGGDWMQRESAMPLGPVAEPQRVVPLNLEHVVPILFATNRKKSNVNRPDEYFLDEEADPKSGNPVTLGRTMVRVPSTHKQGALEQPGWIRLALEKVQPSSILDYLNIAKFKAEDPSKHFTFAYSIEELTQADFQSDLRKSLRSSASRAALLFVHGYANSFKDAAYRTAQLSFDLRLEDYDAVPVLFTWPSNPHGVNYGGAKDRIRSAGGHLATLLNRLVDTSGVGVVHIVAHSMGADVLAFALERIGEANLVVRKRDGTRLSKFHQIILAAPDIRAMDFANVIAPAIASRHRVTVYASSNDGALRASRKLNEDARAGDTDKGLTLVDGVETIDASAVNNELFGHSYFAQSPSMIRDLQKLLRYGATPEARGLLPIRRTTSTYWQFP